jgi:hypothetical protein
MSEHALSKIHEDLRRATHDFGIPSGWVREVDLACTAWLRQRGLLASQLSPVIAERQARRAARLRLGAPFPPAAVAA